MHLKRLFVCILFASAVLLSCSKSETTAPADPYEGGKLFRSSSGTFLVPVLTGSFRQMGRQYGLLLRQEIGEFYQAAIADYLITEKGNSYADLAAAGQQYYADFSQLFRDYIDGMAETNGLGPERTRILANAMLDLGFLGCSSLSAWGLYTTDGHTVTGRNLDLPFPHLLQFSKYYHVVVWNAAGFSASVASIDYIGGVFYQTAINSKGVFLELQNGQNSDTCNPKGREVCNNLLLESLFRNVNSDDYDRWFRTVMPDGGFIMNGSYPDHATIYEWATFRVALRNGDGIVSASNDFTDPSWVNYPIFFFDSVNEGSGKTWTRRTHLLKLGEQDKGEIDPARMMDIFDTTIPDGGATFPDTGLIRTIYSVVVRPAELTMWLKVRGYSGWEAIDLREVFTNQ